MKRIVLDSSALVAHFASEPGGEITRDLFREARRHKVSLSMSAVNLGEAIYIAAQKRGAAGPDHLLKWLPQLPLTVLAADKDDAIAAAQLKISRHLPYADCFVAALALRLHADVVTSGPAFRKSSGHGTYTLDIIDPTAPMALRGQRRGRAGHRREFLFDSAAPFPQHRFP